MEEERPVVQGAGVEPAPAGFSDRRSAAELPLHEPGEPG